ncbi:MAG: LysR family transcriptional regulator [Alphaproteobacteria bacterium]|nr:LysR family transcriptional regulator [Alphaproteobacteria bacterium]
MKVNTDWDKFKLFYYVAKSGSFTAAETVLNITQPSISRGIHLLEHQLKVKLFERVPRGLVLTKQGETLLQATEKAFEEFTRAEVLMLEEEEEPQGSLKIATTMAIATVWIMYHISDFIRLYPKLNLTIIGNDEQLDLKTREADVSIRPFMDNHPGLIQELLFTFHLKLYASKKYLEDYGVPKKPEDLDNHKLIVFGYDAANPYHDINWPLKIGMPKGLLREPYLCINTSAGMRQAAEENHGIIALAAEYPGLETSGFIEVLPDLEKPSIPIYYVYPDQLRESKRVKALGNYLKERFKVKD